MKLLWVATVVLASAFCVAGSKITANVELKVVRSGQQEYEDYQPGVHVGSVNTQGASVRRSSVGCMPLTERRFTTST